MIVTPAPIYSLFKYIYSGPHLDDNNMFDTRIWFYIPLAMDENDHTATYLRFPHNKPEEMEEITVNTAAFF